MGPGTPMMKNETYRVSKRKVFPGWIVAVACAVAVFAGASFQYTFGVFVKPLEDAFGWSRAAISGCVSIRNVISIICAIGFGSWYDKYGPRKFILAGIFLVGLSYLLASHITGLWELYFFFSLLVGIGVTSIYVPAVATTTRWFGRNSSLPNGVVMSGYSVVQIILPPAATFLILHYGLPVCFIVMGIGVWIIGMAAWCFIKAPSALCKTAENNLSGTGPTSRGGDETLCQVLQYPAMWLLMVVNVTAYFNYQMTAIHVVPAAMQLGIGAEAAAIILTLSGIGNTIGRIVIGALANRVGPIPVVNICMAMQAVCLFALSTARGLYVFYLSSIVFGFVYGGVLPTMPTICSLFFGTKAIGSIFSLINASQNLGAALGPLLAGYIFDTTRSYYAAFLSAGVFTGMIFFLSLRLKPPHRSIGRLPV